MIKSGTTIWGSALAGYEPGTGRLKGGTAYSQASAAIQLMGKMLESAGSDLEHVVSVTVFLRDMADFAELNRAYRDAFGDHEPTRSVVSVTDLPKEGALLTMNYVAVLKD